MRGAATRARISIVDPVAEKPRVEAKTIEWMTGKGETRGPKCLDLIRRDSDRGDIPKSDTQSGELVCGASAAHLVLCSGWISWGFFYREREREMREGRNRGAEKKPPGAMNDIIEFHAAPIPVSDHPWAAKRKILAHRNFKVWKKHRRLMQCWRRDERRRRSRAWFRAIALHPNRFWQKVCKQASIAHPRH